MIITILGMDPGLSNAGYSICTYNLKTKKLIVIEHGVIKSSQTVSKVAFKSEVFKFGKRIISLAWLRKTTRSLIKKHNPNYITIEGGFFNKKRPNAFTALVQCILTITHLAYLDFKLPVYKIQPRSIKQVISGFGGSDKETIELKVLKHKNIKFKEKVDVEKFTEHEADCIALVYTFTVKILPKLLKKNKEKFDDKCQQAS